MSIFLVSYQPQGCSWREPPGYWLGPSGKATGYWEVHKESIANFQVPADGTYLEDLLGNLEVNQLNKYFKSLAAAIADAPPIVFGDEEVTFCFAQNIEKAKSAIRQTRGHKAKTNR